MLDAQVELDITTLEAEIDELGSECDRASDETKIDLQAKMDRARAQLQARVDDIQARLQESQQETESKIRSLLEQASRGRGDRKAKIEKHILELQTQRQRRSRLLHQAGELIKDAVRA